MPAETRGRQHLADVLVIASVAALYVICAKLGLALAWRAAQVSVVWPPTGFALAAMMAADRLFPRVGGQGWRGWRAATGIFAGAFAANLTADEPAAVALTIAAGNLLEALTGAAILRRGAFDSGLARIQDVIALLLALAVSALVSATIGVTALGAGGVQAWRDFPILWMIWYVGDALGGLIFAPALLVWTAPDALRRSRDAISEAALLLVLLVVTTATVFVFLPAVVAAEYVVFPFLIWAAIRLGPRGATTVAVVVNVIAIWGTHSGKGPFASADPESGLMLLQLFIAVAATTGLLLAAQSAQRRAAQDRAEHSEQRLLMAIKAARLGVWEWEIGTGRVTWSGALEPLHGLPEGAFAGTYDAYRKTIHPEDVERVETAIRESLETRTSYESEFRLLGEDGIVRWTDARGTVITDESGQPVRMIGIGIDVTRQKELEEKLRNQDRRKDEFLAMLGHELRNPLAPIMHAVEFLDERDPQQLARARDVIRRQSQHVARLVDDLLDVSRISRGSVLLDRRRITLAEIFKASVDAWRYLIDGKRIHLAVTLPERPLVLDADPTRLIQVLSNLVHNALKFTPEEGEIVLEAEDAGDMVVIRLRDSGVGMTADVLAHAFELFMQGPPPLDRPHGGLGIGLTLVRSLVELHGGTVTATSNGPDRGSEFVVRLPLAQGATASVAVPPPPPSDGAAPRIRRVLIVEDNADARHMLAFVVKRDGHEVLQAADGPSAVETAARFVPDLILLDLGLPGQDGYSVARQIRALPSCANAYIVAVTGYGQPDDRERSEAAGFDQHLLKPVDPRVLKRLLRSDLRSRTSR